eukprot:4754572-Pyramimonas_sp.AAC.1
MCIRDRPNPPLPPRPVHSDTPTLPAARPFRAKPHRGGVGKPTDLAAGRCGTSYGVCPRKGEGGTGRLHGLVVESHGHVEI